MALNVRVQGTVGSESSFTGSLCGHKGIEGYQENECCIQGAVSGKEGQDYRSSPIILMG